MSKVSRSWNITEFHRAYALHCKESGTRPISLKDYKKIIQAMGSSMSDILLEHGIIGLPWYMGDIYFRKHVRSVTIDRHNSIAYKKRIFEFNEHTDGYVYKLSWLSPERIKKQRNLWVYTGHRDMRRKSAKLFKKKLVSYPDFKQMNSRA
jgi:hypothetical protein